MSHIHPEDPRVTAHALGELAGADVAAVERAAMTNPAVARAIEETRQMAACLESAFGAEELGLDPARREAVRQAGRMPVPEKIISRDRARRWGRVALVTGIAAGLLAGAVFMMVNTPVGERRTTFREEAAQRREAQLQVLLAPAPAAGEPRRFLGQGSPAAPGAEAEITGVGSAEYHALGRLMSEDPAAFFRGVEKAARTAHLDELRKLPPLVENDFLSCRDAPRARVPQVAGTASFAIVERFVRGANTLPPKNAVRVEELVNEVRYDNEWDAEMDDIRLGTELVRCPWDAEAVLLGVLLQNGSGAPLPATANLEINFKPDMVRSYRLLGYARGGAGRFPPVSRSLGAGDSNFVLYELLPAKQSVFTEHGVLLRVGLVLSDADEASPRAIISPVSGPPRDWDGASGNFQTASTLAAFGLLLRESPHRGALDAGLLRRLASRALAASREADLARRDALQLALDAAPLLEAVPPRQE
ncbi:MAG: DUF3520 domain-containing protein [Akkermansiaceae bacterium]|nr:DUF3520 domain-containing protein [Akkermansiaceae bacterium]NNM28446.1 DUF3520 domain-containing protein [Akkermansiaceae bacterium]